jgi:UDP-4-amino-4,6-dideoxy-N-acetyl-beta-L-altrosamine N-acetyltransferase
MATYRLRLLEESDLTIILEWRNSKEIREVSFNKEIICYEDHLNWYLASKKSKATLLIFEIDSISSGFVKFELVDTQVAEWSFYKDPNNPEKYGNIMGQMAINYAFSRLQVNKLIARVVNSNLRSLKYHELLGFEIQELQLYKLTDSIMAQKNVTFLELLNPSVRGNF